MPLSFVERSLLAPVIAALIAALPPKARTLLAPQLVTLDLVFNPVDRRYRPNPESAAARSATCTSTRACQIFKGEHAITRETIRIIGWGNLSRELGMTEASIRVRLCRGQSYMARRVGLEDGVIITKTNQQAETADTSNECLLDRLREKHHRLGFPGKSLHAPSIKEVMARPALQHLAEGAKVPSQDAPVAEAPPAPAPRPRRRRL